MRQDCFSMWNAQGQEQGMGRHTIWQSEILKVDVCLRIQLAGGLDKCVDKFVVPLTPDSFLPQTKVERIIQELLVVGAAVQHYWKNTIGMDARTESGQNQLSNGDQNATTTLVAYA